MLVYSCMFTFTLITFIKSETSLLTSSYSQVSRAGSTLDEIETQGRSSGQTPWAQSSTAHVIRGQNLKSNHRYSTKQDNLVDKGVAQERFNPRPWFAYEPVKGPTYIPPASDNSNKPDFAIPFESFPLQMKTINSPSSILKPPYDTQNPTDQVTPLSQTDNFDDSGPSNTYGSPYDSYNPSPATDTQGVNRPTSKPIQNYVTPPRNYLPPKTNYPAKEHGLDLPEYLGETEQMYDQSKEHPPKEAEHGSDEYSEEPVYLNHGPSDKEQEANLQKDQGQNQEYQLPEYLDHDPNGQKMKHPPKQSNHPNQEVYSDQLPEYLEHDPKKHMQQFHDPPGGSDDSGPPLTLTVDHPGLPYLGRDPKESFSNKPSGYSANPAADLPNLPSYLTYDPNGNGHSFDHYQYDHHPPIYHEIKTTTPAAEDERLNKKPYSYYYLGRKLWYIPLYFSVYFICYIFVLIVKSIARHKITFTHYFEDDKRDMKDMQTHVDDVDHHFHAGLEAARRKYIM